MATSALQPPRVSASRHAWARALALAPFAIVLAASLIELALANHGAAAVELDELYLPPQNALAAFATLTRAGSTVALTMPRPS